MRSILVILAVICVLMLVGARSVADPALPFDRPMRLLNHAYSVQSLLEKVSTQCHIGVVGSLGRGELTQRLYLNRSDGTGADILNLIADQIGRDWLPVGNVAVFPQQVVIRVPPFPVQATWMSTAGLEDAVSGHETLLVRAGVNASGRLRDFFDTLPTWAVANMLDGQSLKVADASALSQYALLRLIADVDPRGSLDYAGNSVAVSIIPLPWFAAQYYYALAGCARAQRAALPGCASVNISTFGGQEDLRDVARDLFRPTHRQILVDHRIPNFPLVAMLQNSSAGGSLSAIAEVAEARLIVRFGVIHFEAPTEYDEQFDLQGGDQCTCVVLPDISSCLHGAGQAVRAGIFPGYVLCLAGKHESLRIMFFVRAMRPCPGVSYSCGVSALLDLASAVGRNLPDKDAHDLIDHWPDSSLSMENLAEAGASISVRLVGVSATISELSTQLPCIIATTTDHFVLLVSVTPTSAYIIDNGIQRIVPTAELNRVYRGVALVRRL